METRLSSSTGARSSKSVLRFNLSVLPDSEKSLNQGDEDTPGALAIAATGSWQAKRVKIPSRGFGPKLTSVGRIG